MTNWLGHGGGWGGDAPVFDVDWPSQSDGAPADKSYDLPMVWITVQQWEPSEGRTGRNCVWHYTPNDDPDGMQALDFGSDYYNEGMNCDPESEHEKRVMCFRAAELLYLHASIKGNAIADLCLGYVYSYDRCEGRYWDRDFTMSATNTDVNVRTASPDEHVAFDRDALAYLHFCRAAHAGIAEACYKLGDLLRDGRGCKMDLDEAFQWFTKAYDLGKSMAPVIWGSAALRLGNAYENGEGCTQSFEDARGWYELATTGLGIAVRGGERWYRGALRCAEAGLVRAKQELSGRY